MPPVADLLRAIAILFVALMAPRRMAMARVRGLSVDGLVTLMECLEWLRRRGRRLRAPGETLETVAARIDLIVWIARTPARAYRHLALQLRGWKRARFGGIAPPGFGAVRLWLAPLAARAPAPAFADSS
jgi:hypothetical protein